MKKIAIIALMVMVTEVGIAKAVVKLHFRTNEVTYKHRKELRVFLGTSIEKAKWNYDPNIIVKVDDDKVNWIIWYKDETNCIISFFYKKEVVTDVSVSNESCFQQKELMSNYPVTERDPQIEYLRSENRKRFGRSNYEN